MNTKVNFDVFSVFPKIESNRLILRELQEYDAPELYKIRSNSKVMEFMDTYTIQSIKETQKLILDIQESFKNKKGINWGIMNKSSSKLIGYFGYWRLIPEHCRAEIGYALLPNYWNNGIMKETMQKLFHFGFNNLNLHSIEANVNPKNISSIKLLEKFGFRKEAHFRENFLFNNNYLDSFIYSMLESDFK